MTYYGKILEDVISSPTAPVNPEPDQVWWDSTNNTIKIWKDNKWVLNTPAFTSASVDWADIEHKPSSYPPTLPIPISGVQNLDTNLNNKEPTITAGSISQYWRGDKTWQTLPPSIPDAPKDDLIYGRKNGAWVDAGGAGSGSSYTFEYSFNGNIIVPPSSGQVRLNTVDQTQATLVYMSEVTAPGIDASHVLSQFYIRQKMLIQDKDDATKWQRYAITGLPVDQGNYFEVPVQWLEGGGAVPVQRCVVDVTSPPGVEEAPLDGAIYGRSSGTWNNLSDELALKLDLTGGTLTGPVIFGQSISAGTVATFNGLAGFNARVDLFGVENRINVANQSWITFSGDGNTQGAWAEGVRAGNLYRGYSSMASGSLRLVWGITSLNDTAPFNFYVPTVFSGDVSISKTAPVLSIEKSASGQQSGIQYKTGAAGAGLLRWAAYSNNAAESGANAGSNYQILRYDDAGVGIDVPFQLVRSSGDATFSHNVNITGTSIAIYARISSTTGTSYLYMDAPAGQGRYLRFRSVSSERWQIGVNNVAETGTPNINAGSDFVFNRFSDAGVSLGTAGYFNRYNGGLYLMSGILGIAPTAGPGNPGLGQDGELWVTASGLYAQINGVPKGPFVDAAAVAAPNPLHVLKTGDTMTGPLTLTSVDPGAVGATLTALHDTVSPAIDDAAFKLVVKSRDDSGAIQTYAEFSSYLADIQHTWGAGGFKFSYLDGWGIIRDQVVFDGYAGPTFNFYDDTNAQGPNLHLARISASAAVNDLIGGIMFMGNTTTDPANLYGYAQIRTKIIDPVIATLSSQLIFKVAANNASYLDALTLGKTAATFTVKGVFPSSAAAGAGINIGQGPAPTSPADGDVWILSPGQQLWWRSSGQSFSAIDVQSTQSVTGGKTFTAKQTFRTPSSTGASILLPHGVAPSAPVNGDFWTEATGFYGRVNGVTIGPFGAAGSGGIADAPNDGTTYGRKNLGWVAMSGGALSEAPTDGIQYSRMNAGWSAVNWTNLTGKPTTFTPAAHVHAESEVTNLVTDLAAKANLAGATFTGKVNIPSTIAASAYLNLGTGTVSPTSPVNGDFWLNTFTLWYRSLGVSYQVLTPSSSTTITAGWAFTGKPTFRASDITSASFTIYHGSAPSAGASVNGDIWTTTAGIYAWINGAAQGPFIDATNAAVTNKVLKAGDTMTGNLVIGPAAGDSRLYLDKAASGSNSAIFGRMAGKNRWYIVLGNTSPETGSDAGSNFQLTSLGDDGTTVLNTPISITRSTGVASIPKLTTTTQTAGTSTTDVATTAFVTTADALAEKLINKGVANGYAPLDAGAKIAAAYLPSYVDDVLEYANLAAFPVTGTTGLMYVALDTNKVYRWSGSAYVEISPSPGSTDAVPEGSLNLYYTNSRALAATAAAYVDVAGDTMTGKLITMVPTAGGAGLNLAPTSISPTTPVNGDIWITTSGNLWYQANALTLTAANLQQAQIFSGGVKTFTNQTIQGNAWIGNGTDGSSSASGLTMMKRGSGYNEVIAFSDGAAGQRGAITMLPAGNMVFRVGDGVTDKVYIDSAGVVFPKGISSTGDIGVVKTSPAYVLDKVSANSAGLYFKTATVNRWLIESTAVAESAGAGSNFAIRRYNDAGSSIVDTPIAIARDTGILTLGVSALASGSTATTQARGTNTTALATTAFVMASPGISETPAYEANTDFNTIVAAGWYGAAVGPNAPNQPPVVNYFHIQNVRYTSGEVIQMAYPLGRHAGAAIWYRSLSATVWTNWVSIQTSATVKDVAQRVPYTPTLDYTAEQISVINTSLRTTTATYVSATGLIKTAAINAPRINYDPTTLIKRGFLCECGKTNLAFYSQDLDNAYWTKTLATITANVAATVTLAPDGLATADKLVEDTTATSSHLLTRNITASASTIYTFSIFVKPGERTKFQLQFSGNSGSNHVNVDLTAKTATLVGVVGWTAATCMIVAYPNGWFRISSTATTNAGLTSVDVGVALQDATGTLAYTGDGASGLYLWGAQLETGLSASSYIPTTTAAVTRGAETATVITLSSTTFSDIAGTFFIELTIDGMRSDGAADSYVLFQGTVGNSINLRAGTVIGGIDLTVGSNSVTQVDTGSKGYVYGKTVRLAVAWAPNDFAYSGDGGVPLTGTGSLPIALTTLSLPVTMVQGSIITINRFVYWPKRLTNNELQIITSLQGANP